MDLSFLYIYIIIILSAVFHEYAHGFAAYLMGDNTAEREGRLTLNPVAHIDPIGTILVPLFLMFTAGVFIGWAKPVPYNPYNLSDQKYGNLKVAIAGPAVNLIIALILGLFIRFLAADLIAMGALQPAAVDFIGLVVYVNIILALFNLIPVPPLDGSKVLGDLMPAYRRVMARMGFLGIFLALLLAMYFLAPVARTLFQGITGISLFG